MRPSVSQIIDDSAQRGQRAGVGGQFSRPVTPAAAQPPRAVGWWPRDVTTSSSVGFFRNDSRRVPKW